MHKTRFKLPFGLYIKLAQKVLKDEEDEGKLLELNKASVRKNAKDIANAVNDFSKANLRGKLTLGENKIVAGHINMAFTKQGGDKKDGILLKKADILVKFLLDDTEATLYSYIQAKQDSDLQKHLAPYYKNRVKIENIHDLYEKKSKDDSTDTRSKLPDLSSEIADKSDLNELSKNNIEAINIVERVPYMGKTEEVHLKDIYVPREVEEKVVDVLNRQEGNTIILVSGQAGNGKTSLLWSVYREYKKSEIYTPLFLKSSDIKQQSLTIKGDIATTITRFAKLIETEDNKKLLLFIDTLDLLFQEQKSLDYIQLLFKKLRDSGIIIVCSSRVQEGAVIKGKINLISFELKRYTEDELKVAIEKHTGRYAFMFTNYDPQTEYDRIQNLVDKGFPIREVCYNPLTFRMLYSIYAPNQIHGETNIFELYKNFWKHRVESDIRPGVDDVRDRAEDGSSILDTDQLDMSRLAFLIALLMIKLGSIEVKRAMAESLFAKKQIPKVRINNLINRGILRESIQVLSFFHQTFFEFSVAKALVTSELGADLFKNEITKTANNLFLLPIYEQFLALSQYDYSLTPHINLELIRLLKSEYTAEQYSSLYAYILLEEIKKEDSDRYIKLLTEKNNCIPRYFELLPNTHKGRIEVVFNELFYLKSLISKNYLPEYFDLLHRFATYQPKHVYDFIVTSNISDIFLEVEKIRNDKLLHYVETVGCLLPTHFNWAVEHFIHIISKFPENDKLHEKIYNTIAAFLSNNEHFDIEIEKFYAQIENVYANKTTEIPYIILNAFANLWLYEWKKGRDEAVFGLSVQSIGREASLNFSSKLVALTEIVGRNFERGNLSTSIYSAIDLYEELNSRAKVAWSRCFFANLICLEKLHNSKAGKEIIDFFKGYLSKHIYEDPYDGNFDYITSGLRIKIIPEAFNNEIIRSLFADISNDSSDVWLTTDFELYQVLSIAIIAECSSALKAINDLLKGNIEISIEDRKKVLDKVKGHIAYNSKQRVTQPVVYELLQQLDGSFEKFIEMVESHIKHDDLKNLSPSLSKTMDELLNDLSGEKRRRGYRIMVKLLSENLIESLHHEEIVQRLNTEADEQCQQKILFIIAEFSSEQSFDYLRYEVKGFLEANQDSCSYDDFFNQYIKLLLRNKNFTYENTSTLLNLILTPCRLKADSRFRLQFIKPMTKGLLKRNTVKAFDVFSEFLCKLNESYMEGKTSIRRFASSMRPVVKEVAVSINEAQYISMLSISEHTLIPVGQDIIRTFYTYNLMTEEVMNFLEKKQKDPTFPDELKVTIDENIYQFGRILYSGTAWEEVDTIIKMI